MRWHGFHFHRLPHKLFFTVYPLRPLTLLAKQSTPAKKITYWYRPHTAKTRLPVLFIHGIGIGLYPYVNFLAQINEDDSNAQDGQIGIIAIEMMPVSFRLTSPALKKDEMCDEIHKILKKHGWDKVVLASHSYGIVDSYHGILVVKADGNLGSVISTHLLHNSKTSRLVGPIFLIDPVSILLHLPDVAYNFTCRKPQRANEHQLYCKSYQTSSTQSRLANTLRLRKHGSRRSSYLRQVSLCCGPVMYRLRPKLGHSSGARTAYGRRISRVIE